MDKRKIEKKSKRIEPPKENSQSVRVSKSPKRTDKQGARKRSGARVEVTTGRKQDNKQHKKVNSAPSKTHKKIQESSSQLKKETTTTRETLNQYKFVIKELTAREIKRKYSRSMLGVVWSVLNPLLSMVVISLVFSQIFERAISNFPIYYLSGYLIWQMFTEATKAAMTTFVDNKPMLIKVKLPMQIFVLARVYTALVNLEYSFVAYCIMLFVFKESFKVTMLFAPVIVIFLLLFSLGVAYTLATAYVFFGDVKHLYSVFLTLLMYCSAIFYPVDRLQGFILIVVRNNPIFNFIDAMRKIVLLGELPTIWETFRLAALGVGVYALGYAIFKRNKNAIMQKI